MQPVEGRLSDGRTAASHLVQVGFDGEGLLLTRPGVSAVSWPYDGLSTSAPISAASVDVLLGHRDHKDATLFVAAPAFASNLLARAPNLGAGRQRWNILKPMLAVVAVLAAIVASTWIFNWNPSQVVARGLPEAARARIGDQVIAGMIENRRVCETPEARAALNQLTTRLVGTTDRAIAPSVQVVDWSLVNAFAVPGRRIVIMRGLIDRAQSADELAGVLAHEIGHTIELHPETALVRAVGLTAGLQIVFTGSPGTAANIGVLLATLRYTRIAEAEADEQALRLLRNAGISPQGLAQFFERMEKSGPVKKPDAVASPKKEEPKKDGKRVEAAPTVPSDPLPKQTGKQPPPRGGYGEVAGELLSTHPMTERRIARIREVAVYPSTPALSPEAWNALKTACGPLPAVKPAPDVAPKPAPRNAPTTPRAPDRAPPPRVPEIRT